MKSIINVFKNMQAFSFLVGMAFGAAIGLVLFCYMVPHGPSAIKMLQHYVMHMRKEDVKNKEAFQKLYASSTIHMQEMSKGGHGSHNPYLMSTVTSEEQFLRDMILHQQAAVTMAQQVLTVPVIHDEVRRLANDIITTQGKEIEEMQKWIVTWRD
jgi:uncharacterized protein (DUF305 family)